MYCSGDRISWPVSTVTHVYDCKVSLYTVLCKSIANEFRRNSWLFGAFQRNFAWNDISMKFTRIFVTPIVLICAIFWTLIYFARWFTANFRVIIRSSWKVAVIFRTIMCSSRKFDNHIVYQQAKSVFKTQFANDLSNHCVRKKPLICRNSITARRNVSYETHLVISEGMLNFWLDPKPQNTIVPINKCNCT